LQLRLGSLRPARLAAIAAPQLPQAFAAALRSLPLVLGIDLGRHEPDLDRRLELGEDPESLAVRRRPRTSENPKVGAHELQALDLEVSGQRIEE
jgi:hypothetical protein